MIDETLKKINHPRTTPDQAKKMLISLAEYCFERGWKRHDRFMRGIHSWEAAKMKTDFDEWQKENINKMPIDRLHEVQRFIFNYMHLTNFPK
ncbi:MAG: hypothetical protein ACOC22_02675 [bacterium]